MIKIKVQKEELEEATQRFKFYNLSKSVSKGYSQLHGALGEVVCRNYYANNGAHAVDSPDTGADLIINGLRIDVKTRKCNSEPKPHYNAGVFASTYEQTSDYFLFTRILNNFSIVWILGFYATKAFLRDATLCRKGQVEFGSWRYPEDCYNLPISSLHL